MSQRKKYNVLITGGAGYLGKFLVHQFLTHELIDDRLVVFSRDELKHFHLKLETDNHPCIQYVIGDVRDKDRLAEAMKGIDLVIHAAAMKQVSTCEANPMECLKTNVHGTEHVIEACQRQGVKQLIFVSTDKAVSPISVYGNSKQTGEKLVLNASREGLETSVIRFGNFIGSPGSLAHKLSEGHTSKITLVDPEATRFVDHPKNAWELIQVILEKSLSDVILIHKLRAKKVTDLIEEWNVNGLEIIRGESKPYEKTHELLIGDYELPRTLEGPTFYLIPPKQLGLDQAIDRYGLLPAQLTHYHSAHCLQPSNKERNKSS